jgi:hypothetical protein
LDGCALCREHVEALRASFGSLDTELSSAPNRWDVDYARKLLVPRRLSLPSAELDFLKREEPNLAGFVKTLAASNERLIRRGMAMMQRNPGRTTVIGTAFALFIGVLSFLYSRPDRLELHYLEPRILVGNNAADTLTVRGRGFRKGTQVVVSIIEPDQRTFVRRPTIISNEELKVPLRVGTDPSAWVVQVMNPDSTFSDTLQFRVIAPRPETPWLIPKSTKAGGEDFTLSIAGTTFTSFSVVQWNGENRPTTPLVSRGGLVVGLTATIFSSDIAQPGKAEVRVFTPGPGGGISNAATFEILK